MSTAGKKQISKNAGNSRQQQAPKGNQVFLFDRGNYTWMIAGFVLIIAGFFLMTGGKSPDPTKFNYDEIYSFRRVTLAPVLIMLGFVIEVYAIMKKPVSE